LWSEGEGMSEYTDLISNIPHGVDFTLKKVGDAWNASLVIQGKRTESHWMDSPEMATAKVLFEIIEWPEEEGR